MFTQSFTVSGCSLELMNNGEQGIVTSCKSTDEVIIKKLMAMGIRPGVSLSLERQFPSFIIKVGHTRLVLDKEIVQTVYVRIINEQ